MTWSDLMEGWTVEEFPNYQGDPELTGARIVSDSDVVAEVSGAVICGGWGRHQIHTDRARLLSAAPDMRDALVEAKKALWLGARDHWTLADFKNWAVVQQIDTALEKATGVDRSSSPSTAKDRRPR